VVAYPVVVWLARRMQAWDPVHDAVMAGLGFGVAALAVWLNGGAIADLAALSGW
jgi:hypothetical protein